MKEVDTHVDPEVVRDMFDIVKQCKTEQDCKDLQEIFNRELTVSALNSIHPDKPVNILHTLAVSDNCKMVLPHLNKYIDYIYNAKNHQGDTPVKVAISAGRLDNAKVLVDAQRSTLKEKGFIKSQIDKEIAYTVNIQDSNGGTSLHRAAHAHRPEYIKFLLDIGADPTIKDKEGKIAIVEAAEKLGDNGLMIKTIARLVKTKEDLYVPIKNGSTLLDIIEDTQKLIWGKHQRNELLRACDRQTNKSSCIIM